MTEPSLLDLFTDSWLANSGDDMASRAARRSLEASTYGNAELTSTLTWLKLASQAELDLHLAGAGVRGHQTDAVPFGKFIQRAGESVRELARTAFGAVKAVASLQVLAPTPGSVRVVFRSPDLPDPGFSVRNADFNNRSADTLALELLTEVLAVAASDDIEDSGTLAAIHGLKPPARAAIARMARTIKAAGWDIDGELRQRGRDSIPVQVTPDSADRIVRAVGMNTVETSTETMTGLVDGTRRSTLVMWFIPPAGRPFGASVTSPELIAEVARIAAFDVPRAKAMFTVHTVHATTDSQTVSRQYVLESLEPAELQARSESDPDLFGLE